jgi:hypothetical protein
MCVADRDCTEADLRTRLAATLDLNISSPVTVILPVFVVLGLVLSFLPADPWCAAETDEGEGLAHAAAKKL